MAARQQDLDLPRVDPAQPAGAQVFDMLRAAILEMRLLPGASLSEAEIATEVGASRTPVREALAQLREAGLVHTLPSRGSFVARLSRDGILQAQFLREALELANIRRLAEAGLPAPVVTALRATLERQSRAVAAQDRTGFHLADDAFHLALAEATGFARAARVLEREKLHLDRLRALPLRDPAHLDRLMREHRAILDALTRRDGPGAEAAMRVHLRSVLDVLEDLHRRHAEFFD